MGILTVLLAFAFAAQRAPAANAWEPLGFLVGEWAGEGKGAPGVGTGAASFAWDLERNILVRRSRAEYPGQRAHEDLMIVYDEPGRGLRAIYFDSEKHVIRYAVRAAGGGVEFLSEEAQGQPRFRLTYTPAGPDVVRVKFEIAPPGKPFQTYVEGTTRRVQPKR